MKRMKKVILLIIPIIMLTGCANTLKCEIKTGNYKSEVKIKFKDDKPTTYKFEDAMDFSNTLGADSELYLDSKQTQYGNLVAEKYAKVNEFQNIVKVKINYDFSKNNSTGENTLLISKTDSLGNAKQKIESSGYNCK